MTRGRPRKRKSTLPPCYYQSHGAVYHVHKNKWRHVGTAADAHAEYAERQRGKGGQLNALIDVAFDAMRARTKPRPLSKNTLYTYKSACKMLKEMLAQFSTPDQVKQKNAAQVKLLLADTPTTANTVLSFARQVFGGWVEQQLIDSNPFLGIKSFPAGKRDRLIKWEEWDAIYAKANPRLQLVMDGLFLTDQRISDVVKIDERDILDDGPGIYFKQQKTRKELIVAWNPQLRDWVTRCRALRGNIERLHGPRPLFRNKYGKQLSYDAAYDDWIAAVALTNVKDCNLHDNRAFSATEMAKQAGGGEAGERAAQKLLGHEDRKTTKIYLRGREIDVVQGPVRRAG